MLWVELLGYAASLAVLLTFCMSTMIPLRILALASNVLFILYGYFDNLQPVLLLHATLLPVNLYRLFQFQRLVLPGVTRNPHRLPLVFGRFQLSLQCFDLLVSLVQAQPFLAQ